VVGALAREIGAQCVRFERAMHTLKKGEVAPTQSAAARPGAQERRSCALPQLSERPAKPCWVALR